MPFTNTKIHQIKPDTKTIKLFDGGGLFLQVTPAGGKWWRLKYRFQGKEKLLSLGVYPEVMLKVARERRHEMKTLLANGVDPGEYRKTLHASTMDKASNSFEAIAREWLTKYSPNWSAGHTEKITRRLERDVLPWLGTMPISEITAPQVLSVLHRITERGVLETAHRASSTCSQIFRYAIATGRTERNPVPDLKGALPPVKNRHFAAVTEPQQVGELLRAIDGYQGTLVVKSALRLAPLVFVRPQELRTAQWCDINFDTAEWRYLVTKTQTEHIVPLATQSLTILKELHPLTGRGQYVFPSARGQSRPMSDNAILVALRTLGIEKDKMSGHGFRAMARTILDEVLKVRTDYIEHQLAHAVRDPNGRAYNRTKHLSERKAMMQEWADYLDKLKATTMTLSIKHT